MDATQLINESLTGRYVIERELGAGGMATVYLARDVRHDRKVALKVLHPDLAAALGAERFLAEIRTTANLQHPHILPLHDSGEAGGHLFYVMPYVQGETLRDRLTRESLLPIDDALRIAREVGGALDYAHRHGIVHRDVKPENILLHDGSAMVADFGISLAVSAAGTNRMTQTGLSLGTPQYMSPEQAMGEKSVDGRTDVYALGAVTYEMLCGEPPFSGASVQAIVAKVLTERPTPPSTVRDTVPQSVEAAVLKALAKLPADRFATAKAFVEALAPDAVTTVSASVSTSRVTGGVVSKRRRWIGVTAAAAGGVLAGAALAAAAMTSRAATPAPTERYVLGEFPLLDIASSSSMTYTGSPLAIAANGSRVAFVTTDSAGTHVEVRDLDRLETRAIRGTSGATSVAISPDGSAIAYVIDGQLTITDVRAGTPRVVASRAIGPSWGDDGRIYFCAPTIGDGVGGIFRVSANGGKIDTLLTRSGMAFYDPVPSPSGHAVLVRSRATDSIGWFAVGSDSVRAFVEGNTARFVDAGHIVFRSTDGILMAAEIDADAGTVRGKPEALMDGASAESPLMASRFVVARNGSLVYVAGGGAETELAWVGRDGRVIAILDSSSGMSKAAQYPVISPDGNRLAYADDKGIQVYDFAQRTGLRLTGGNTVAEASYPAWTPDGKSISYYALATASDTSIAALYLSPADGSGLPRQIARIDRSIGESAWSPDGKWVLFRTFSNQPGAGDIFGLRFGVDSSPTPLFATNASELLQTISPDGNWMAYATNRSGRQEVVVVPFPNVTAAAWSVSSDGGSEPRWSRSGRELFYRNARGDMISVPINPGSTFAFGSPKRLFSASQFHAYSGHAAYDVSLDGQRFLMGAPARSRLKPRLIFVKNFAAPPTSVR